MTNRLARVRPPVLLSLAVAAVVAAVLAISGFGTARPASATTSYVHACISFSGEIRVISATEHCKNHEIEVFVPTSPITGATGPTGPTGPTGKCRYSRIAPVRPTSTTVHGALKP